MTLKSMMHMWVTTARCKPDLLFKQMGELESGMNAGWKYPVLLVAAGVLLR
jgi:hypothetical protein